MLWQDRRRKAHAAHAGALDRDWPTSGSDGPRAIVAVAIAGPGAIGATLVAQAFERLVDFRFQDGLE